MRDIKSTKYWTGGGERVAKDRKDNGNEGERGMIQSEETDLLCARCQSLRNRTQLKGGESYGGTGGGTNQCILTMKRRGGKTKVQMSGQ